MQSISVIGTAVVCLVFSSTCCAAEGFAEQIVEAMRKRQAAVTTLDARIEDRFLVRTPPGVVREPVGDRWSNLELRKQVVILKDTKMFRRLSGPVWSMRTESEIFEVMTSTFNGESARSLHASAEYSVGFNHIKPYHADRYSLHVLPLVGHFRGLAEGMSDFSPDKWHVIETDARVEDVSCVMLREGKEEGVRYRELWFDIERDFALVRRRDVFHGLTENELSVTYKSEEPLGWVPSTWRVDRYSDGRLIDHSVAKVVKLNINVAIEDSMFNLEFPPGTEVNNPPPRRDAKKK